MSDFDAKDVTDMSLEELHAYRHEVRADLDSISRENPVEILHNVALKSAEVFVNGLGRLIDSEERELLNNSVIVQRKG